MLLPYITTGILLAYSIFISFRYQQTQKKVAQISKKTQRKICKMDSILQNINACYILVGSDFIVRKTNYYTLNNLSEDKTVKRVGDLLHCKNAIDSGECGTHACCKICGVRLAIGRAFHKGENFQRFEASMKLYDANNKHITPCDVHVSGNQMNVDEEQLMVLTVYNISELKNVQRLLQVEKENALSYDKLKTAFIANMSHEVRTPLNAIIGFSSLLAMASSDEEKNMYIDIINKNNDRLLQLVTDILELSQIEAGILDFAYSKFDVNDLMLELHELFRIRLMEKPEVGLVCDAGMEELFLHSERQRVMQIFISLLTNAMKFTQEGEIKFGCHLKDNKEIYFYVKDTGIGISPEERDKIFGRFTKLDREIPGTGLGLALAQTLVEKLGGQIGFDSEQNVGSNFWFTLPQGS